MPRAPVKLDRFDLQVTHNYVRHNNYLNYIVKIVKTDLFCKTKWFLKVDSIKVRLCYIIRFIRLLDCEHYYNFHGNNILFFFQG